MEPKQKQYPVVDVTGDRSKVQCCKDKLALAVLALPESLDFTSVKTCDLVKTKDGYRVSVTRRANAPLAKTELLKGESVVKSMCNHNTVMCKDKLKIKNPEARRAGEKAY